MDNTASSALSKTETVTTPEPVKELLSWRKAKRNRGTIYRWGLDYIEEIAHELLKLPGYIDFHEGGYKTRSGLHYCAESGTRWEGAVFTLAGEGKGMFRIPLKEEESGEPEGAILVGDYFVGVMHILKLSREGAAEWVWGFRERRETREYQNQLRLATEQKNADDLDARDVLFWVLGGKAWYGTEGQLRTLIEKEAGESVDSLWILRLLQGWDDSRRAGKPQHRFEVRMSTSYDRKILNKKTGLPRVSKRRFKITPTGVVLKLQTEFDGHLKPYRVLVRDENP